VELTLQNVTPEIGIVLLAGLVGLLMGSFSTVLIQQLPQPERMFFPNHCLTCDQRFRVADSIPLLSWLALRGRCRSCRAALGIRSPVVEVLTGLGYMTLALLFPPLTVGWGALGLMLLFTLLLVGSAIDLETYTLPDELTLLGFVLGLIFGFLNGQGGTHSLPNFQEAVQGGLLGAGLLVAINQLGTWVMRRFRERLYPEQPIGFQHISLGLLAGTWLGPWWGTGLTLLSVALNAGIGRVVRVPELLTLGGVMISLVLGSGVGVDLIRMVQGALTTAGAVSLLAGVYWWIKREPEEGSETAEEPYDAMAMGFGDVKLAAAIGAFLGWERVLVTLAIATVVGCLYGVFQLVRKADNRVKFGPFLALGAVVATIWGQAWVEQYRAFLGV
jgi:leader peptidase (prepilin peptidase)/N-methyltransferase